MLFKINFPPFIVMPNENTQKKKKKKKSKMLMLMAQLLHANCKLMQIEDLMYVASQDSREELTTTTLA